MSPSQAHSSELLNERLCSTFFNIWIFIRSNILDLQKLDRKGRCHSQCEGENLYCLKWTAFWIFLLFTFWNTYVGRQCFEYLRRFYFWLENMVIIRIESHPCHTKIWAWFSWGLMLLYNKVTHKPILFTSVDFGLPNELCGRGFEDFIYYNEKKKKISASLNLWTFLLSYLTSFLYSNLNQR
jgi:hypothetical protein